MNSTKKIALVTGAYRGLGWGTAKDLAQKGYTVIMTARKRAALDKAVADLKAEGLDVHGIELDTSSSASIEKATSEVLQRFQRIDVLVNNAGVFSDGLDQGVSELGETLTKSITTNTIGPALLIQSVLPSMIKNNFGRIVNVSSGMGGLTEMNTGSLAYRVSKTALNVVTRVYGNQTQGKNIKVNSVCPGWVKTEMGGSGATRELAEGVASIVWAATLDENGPTSGFYRDGKSMAW